MDFPHLVAGLLSVLAGCRNCPVVVGNALGTRSCLHLVVMDLVQPSAATRVVTDGSTFLKVAVIRTFLLESLNFVCQPHLNFNIGDLTAIILNSGNDAVLTPTPPISRRNQIGRRVGAQLPRSNGVERVTSDGLFHGLGYRFDEASRWLTRG